MTATDDYLDLNRTAWNDRTEVHWKSDFYANEEFIKGKSSLKPIELDLLGNVHGASILHLQCHFGQDSISLARLGAEVTGLDLSDTAISKAVELSTLTSTPVNFVCGDVYSAASLIDDRFDMVFTSYGTIGWLPDIERWAETVTNMLKPGGRLVFVEFHPMVWMWDEAFEHIVYRYFNEGPIYEETSGTYADREADISRKEVSWNHGLGEVITALLDKGLAIDSFKEYDWSPYDCFEGMTEFAADRYRLHTMGDKMPMVYSIVASRR